MAEIRHDIRVDVTAVLPPGAASGPVEIAATPITGSEGPRDSGPSLHGLRTQ